MGEASLDRFVASVTVTTDTATVCIFDPMALRHRVDDVGDWWSIPRNELQELVSRHAAILNLGGDGSYEVRLRQSLPRADVQVSLTVPSGRLFIGPGEEISGGGFEPDGEWGGLFVDVPAGDYDISVARDGMRLDISIVKAAPRPNDFTDLIRL
jgi:hypothetical protein